MRILQQKVKAILMGMVLTILGIVLFPIPTKAAGLTYTTLKTDDIWLAGEISVKDEVDYYTITIPSAGWLTVTYQGLGVYDSYIYIQNEDMSKNYDRAEVYYSAENNPKTTYFTLALEPGTYRVKVYGCGSNTGTYRLKASFKAAGNNEKESNNGFETAMPLQLAQPVTGFLSEDDRVDFFKINVPVKQTIRLMCTSYIEGGWLSPGCYLCIYDKDYRVIEDVGVKSGGEENPETYTYEQELLPGTYYIKIYPYVSGTWGAYLGRYTIKYEQKVMTKSIKVSGKTQIVVGKSTKLSASVSPSNTTDKTVYWTSGNPYIAGVDKVTGKVTAYNPGKVRITASAQDGSNVSKVYTVIVLPKKIKLYSASNISTKKLQVSYQTQNGVSGYEIQYATNRKFSHAKTKKISKSRSSVTLSKLSKKTYYVRVRGYVKNGSKYYYGSWSSRKVVRIRK